MADGDDREECAIAMIDEQTTSLNFLHEALKRALSREDGAPQNRDIKGGIKLCEFALNNIRAQDPHERAKVCEAWLRALDVYHRTMRREANLLRISAYMEIARREVQRASSPLDPLMNAVRSQLEQHPSMARILEDPQRAAHIRIAGIDVTARDVTQEHEEGDEDDVFYV